MKWIENKQKVCDLLCKTLQATREWADLNELTLDDAEEFVTVVYEGKTLTKVNVEFDSEWAIMKDVMKALQGIRR